MNEALSIVFEFVNGSVMSWNVINTIKPFKGAKIRPIDHGIYKCEVLTSFKDPDAISNPTTFKKLLDIAYRVYKSWVKRMTDEATFNRKFKLFLGDYNVKTIA